MIFGNVNNEFFDQQTAILPAPLKSALCFLKETDLAGLRLNLEAFPWSSRSWT